MEQEKILKNKKEFESISEMLRLLSTGTLTMDSEDEGTAGYYFRYSDEDFMNALLIFKHVLFNVMFHKAEDKNVSFKQQTKNLIVIANQMVALIKTHTGIDTTKYYHNNPKQP